MVQNIQVSFGCLNFAADFQNKIIRVFFFLRCGDTPDTTERIKSTLQTVLRGGSGGDDARSRLAREDFLIRAKMQLWLCGCGVCCFGVARPTREREKRRVIFTWGDSKETEREKGELEWGSLDQTGSSFEGRQERTFNRRLQ